MTWLKSRADDPAADQSGADELSRVARIYGRYASSPGKRRSWSAENRGNAAIRAELVEAAFDLAGAALIEAKSVLDVGCGTGWWLEQLAADDRISATLHAVELLPERITAARTRAPDATIELGDARSLAYATGSCDVVTLFTVLSSLATIADVELALREARRVLRPGGALLVWEPRFRNPLNRATLFISPALLSRCLAARGVKSRLTTVAPPIARHLGRRTEMLYPRLASIGGLLTHRLICAREP